MPSSVLPGPLGGCPPPASTAWTPGLRVNIPGGGTCGREPHTDLPVFTVTVSLLVSGHFVPFTSVSFLQPRCRLFVTLLSFSVPPSLSLSHCRGTAVFSPLQPRRPSSVVEAKQTSMWSCAEQEDQAPKASRA